MRKRDPIIQKEKIMREKRVEKKAVKKNKRKKIRLKKKKTKRKAMPAQTDIPKMRRENSRIMSQCSFKNKTLS
jgi:hypothetical protein